MPTALVTCHHLQRSFDRYRREYRELGIETVLPEVPGQQLDAAAMAELIVGADAVIAGDDMIDASVLEAGAADRLRGVIKWGIGTDSIDLGAARRLGLPVFNTPGMFAEEVADLALWHLLELARRASAMQASILAGDWAPRRGRTLAGLTAGVIGLGSIGSAIGRRVRALGMEVLGNDIRALDADRLVRAGGARQVELDELLAGSDVVLLACELTPDSRHMLSTAQFSLMRRGSWVINVSRGQLIDQPALLVSLDSGQIGAAGLDVFEVEPLPADDPLREFADRCSFTSHAGSNTAEAVERTNRLASEILFDLLGLRAVDGFEPNRVA